MRARFLLPLAALLGPMDGRACSVEPQPTHEPVYLSWADLRSSVRSEPPRRPAARGKIVLRGNLLLLSEPNRGVHVYDNADPANPKALAFLNIPGNLDLALRGDILYADSFTDLIALDLSALPDIRILDRQPDLFPYDPMQAAGDTARWYGLPERDKGVVVEWKRKGR